jgi:hypothetical protein
VITKVLLDKAVSVMAADHDLGLQLAAIVLGDLAAKNHRDLLRLSDGSIGVEQALAELSRAERRRKMRLSQNSTWEKNSRCRQLASSRSLAVKKGVRCASHFWPQVTSSRGVRELASACRRSGAAHVRKALARCLNLMLLSRRRLASQWC